MEIKRIYKDTNKPLNKKKINGGLDVDHVVLRRLTDTQKFTQRVIDQGVTEGFLSIIKGELVFHTKPKDTKYRIIRKPGHYCCFDGQFLTDEKTARKYVADNFRGQKSPDKDHPAGYRKDNFYFCELIGGAKNGGPSI